MSVCVEGSDEQYAPADQCDECDGARAERDLTGHRPGRHREGVGTGRGAEIATREPCAGPGAGAQSRER